MGTDFSKINADKAQQIINALKDGKINSNEAKDLKLTPEEAAALNEAFSSGEARIGDFVLVNKGKSKDGKKQYSQTKKAEPQIPQEEPGFFEKAFNKVKKDVSKYAKTFTNAWNNSSGFVETTGAMIGATTKTVTDVAKDYAHNVEKGVAEATGSETLGKVAKYTAGIGIVADAAEAVDEVGDWSAGKIRDAAKNYTGTERQLLESFAEFVDNMNAADIALMFVGGAGAAKGFKELPKVLQLLKNISFGKVAVPAMGVAAAASMTSCSPEEINVKQEVGLKVQLSQQDQSALIAAFEKGIDELKKEIQKLGIDVKTYGDQIIDLLTSNNSYLKNIANDMKQNNQDNAKIIEILTNINSTVDTLTSLVEATNENITVNGQSIKAQLNAILNAIKNGGAGSESQLTAYLDDLKNLLQTVIKQQGDQIEIDKDSNTTLKDILAKLDKMDGTTQEKLAAILAVLADIKSIGNEINGKLDKIINKFENAFPDNKDIKAALEKIEKYLEQNNAKTDVTNKLLEKLLNKSQTGGLSQEDLQKILDAIAKNGDKIDTTNKLLEKYGTETTVKMTEILDAIKNIKGGNGTGADLEALLDKVLAKMDANTAKIIDAIGNIKVTGGKVDLGSVEAMLKELIELTKKNGNTLDNIDAKMDVVNVTTKAILDKLGNVDQNVQNILDFIKKNAGSYDDSKLLEKLDKIMDKLDDILAAIKDHKVTVDVTGKVTCECKCGQNHEGILGDLNDILG